VTATVAQRSANEALRPAAPTARPTIALIVTAITAAQAVRAYSQRTFTSNGARAMPTTPTKTFDLELTEAERRDVLLDSELDTVTGGSFDLGSIVGGIAKAVVPLAR
jgi:hypothetical protein